MTTIRTARAERSVKPSARVGVTIEGSGPAEQAALEGLSGYLRSLAGLSSLAFAETVAVRPDLVTRLLGEIRVHIDMPHTDHAAEVAKLRKALEEKQRELVRVEGLLANEGFLAKAAAAVVDATRARRECVVAEIAKLDATVKELEG
ncbi:MAG: hypothetical protein IMZ67_06660 [Acidobacteria bacterium]|nr:hypothetical protein [Acidobacteriota bacterium]